MSHTAPEGNNQPHGRRRVILTLAAGLAVIGGVAGVVVAGMWSLLWLTPQEPNWLWVVGAVAGAGFWLVRQGIAPDFSKPVQERVFGGLFLLACGLTFASLMSYESLRGDVLGLQVAQFWIVGMVGIGGLLAAGVALIAVSDGRAREEWEARRAQEAHGDRDSRDSAAE